MNPDVFQDVFGVAELFSAFERPWFVCGGWAIDLFLGKETREHADLEIGIFRQDQRFLTSFLKEWSLQKMEKGHLKAWSSEEDLALPVHEIHAAKDDAALEILFNEGDEKRWIYRRDTRVVHEHPILVQEHIPFLAPEIALLYKSKHMRAADQADFEKTLPYLTQTQREWLEVALQLVEHEHSWLALLRR